MNFICKAFRFALLFVMCVAFLFALPVIMFRAIWITPEPKRNRHIWN